MFKSPCEVHTTGRSPALPWWSFPARLPLVSSFFILLLFVPSGPGLAQVPSGATITDLERTELIGRMTTLLEDRYVFPDLGAQLADSLRLDERSGSFARISDPEELAGALSERIRSLSGDGHLWVMMNLDPGDQEEPEQRPAPAPVPTHLTRVNFGFPKAEILPGNVGYLDVRQFVAPAHGGETLASVMAYLGNVDALVLDLRESGGGSQGMVALLASYFLEQGSAVHLFDSYHRPSDRTDQSWTLNYLPTRRLTTQPLFILTAARTFSAGEGLAYILKHLERATLVGETTGGGANPGAFHRLNSRFVMFVAESRVTSPVTGANWEGAGVRPHVAVPADAALDHAHHLAVRTLRDSTEDDERRRELDDLMRQKRP
jgi:retinol-binding protein 3